MILHIQGQLTYLSLQIFQRSICVGLKHSFVCLEHCKLSKVLLMQVQNSLVLRHVSQHLISKGIGSPLPLIVHPLSALLLSLETRWSIILLEILHRSLRNSISIREILMVPQGWGIVGWKVIVWLEVVAYIPTNKLGFFNLKRAFMSKPLLNSTFLPNTFHQFQFIIGIPSFILGFHLFIRASSLASFADILLSSITPLFSSSSIN